MGGLSGIEARGVFDPPGEGEGGREVGAPNLTDAVWLYGGDYATLVTTVQRARFGELPLTSSGDNNLSSPFGGLVEQLGGVLPPSSGPDAFRLLSMMGLIALIVAASVVGRRFLTAFSGQLLDRSHRFGELAEW